MPAAARPASGRVRGQVCQGGPTGTGTMRAGWGIGTAHLTVTANYGDTGAQAGVGFPVNTGTRPDPRPVDAAFSLSAGSGRAGDRVGIAIEGAGAAGEAHVTSDAFGGRVGLVRGADGVWRGRATVSGKVPDRGSYRVTGYTGGQEIGRSRFTVEETAVAPPLPGRSTLTVAPGRGAPGDRVAVVLTGTGSPDSRCTATSAAFVGPVSLALYKDGKWHGTATVADVPTGTYKVAVDSGADPARFTVVRRSAPPVRPPAPSEQRIPKGSVNTGR